MATAAADPNIRTGAVLSTRFYSHATLECKDIDRTRQFFDEFLGFDTVRMGAISFWARMGGDQVIVVVQGPRKQAEAMPFLNHNGLDVATDADVDRCHELVRHHAETWGLHKISRPVVQHGTYCFYFWDMDDNAWEILSNPKGGYSWGFEMGDQEGAGHMSRKFQRPQTSGEQ